MRRGNRRFKDGCDARVYPESALRRQPLLVLLAGFGAALVLGLVLWSVGPVEGPSVWAATDAVSVAADGPVVAQGRVAVELSPVFTPEVRYWETQILGWASGYGLDPNLVATVMQIESCGNPLVASPAGAQGLFQVMPFHFAAGEAMLDPDTNARRGLGYLLDSLESTGGHVGMALAGYNGGHVAAQGSWSTWPEETRRYYRWANGIYQDASSGMVDSPTLHDWLQAGGASLCQRAAAELAK